MRRSLAAVGLFAAAAASAGCHTVTLAPESPAWAVTGADDAARATWAAGDVEVVVPLTQPDDAAHVAADVRNSGVEGARLTFAVPPGASDRIAVGTVSGGPPTFDREWSKDVFPGRPIDVPPGDPGRPGAVRLALRPDTRWGPGEAPAVGSRITLEFTLTTPAGSAACPFRFRVTGSSNGTWESMTETGRALVVVVLALATAAIIVWAN